MRTVRIVGPGRAGSSLAGALERTGWVVDRVFGRGDDVSGAAHGVDVVVIATPDTAIGEVARAIEPDPACVVCHLSGASGLEVLAPHTPRASMHPLVALPDPVIGCERLLGGAWFAVAGDGVAREMAEALGGHAFRVDDGDRAAYHAAAAIAANHVVALLGQAQRIAETIGVPFGAYMALCKGAVEDAALLGPAKALTGPAARGDDATLARHRDALWRIAPEELAGYVAGTRLAKRLAEQR